MPAAINIASGTFCNQRMGSPFPITTYLAIISQVNPTLPVRLPRTRLPHGFPWQDRGKGRTRPSPHHPILYRTQQVRKVNLDRLIPDSILFSRHERRQQLINDPPSCPGGSSEVQNGEWPGSILWRRLRHRECLPRSKGVPR